MNNGFGEKELEQYFRPCTQIYKNTKGVVEEMEMLLNHIELPTSEKNELIELAYLHKIGFSQKVVNTGFEPLDGALYCKSKDYSFDFVSAVMFSFGAFAVVEQNFPDLLDVYLEYKYYITPKAELFIDLITYCNLQRSATGEKVDYQHKLSEIYTTFGELHNYSNTIKSLESHFKENVIRVERLQRRSNTSIKA
ncbi:hypothetical protein [Priestia aryabhattai]